jgi:hypothetical protein
VQLKRILGAAIRVVNAALCWLSGLDGCLTLACMWSTPLRWVSDADMSRAFTCTDGRHQKSANAVGSAPAVRSHMRN